MRKSLSVALATVILASCTTHPDKIAATYVSPTRYASLECSQIDEEFREVQSRVNGLSGDQRRQNRNDKIATGVGIVVFWPALFFLMSDDKKEEIAMLKGEYEALEVAHDRKNCLDTAFGAARVEAEKNSAAKNGSVSDD